MTSDYSNKSNQSNGDNNLHANNDNLSDVITKKLEELFDEAIVSKCKDEDVTYKEAIQDLLSKEADSPIYTKLGLNYGKAIRFRNEFSKLFSPTTLTLAKGKNKRSMGKLESCTPEMKRLYLQKRKRVVTLTKTHWKNDFPKFHTPESKAELLEFAESIEQDCAIPGIGFGIDGICDHIRSYFSEQRRYSKFRRSSEESSDSSSGNGDTPPEPRMTMVCVAVPGLSMIIHSLH
ncbi:uncharacterized protein LOC110242276 [Exaiptasia diaphana]|uniref:Uncharacterized protein n=1 Tax=Exaiptasia diaphana TaxID=2652724 RepID=A0A913XFD0_EXADI|nr:uncharacterized protein LOC110242276 [Exaiptasia diaphana]